MAGSVGDLHVCGPLGILEFDLTLSRNGFPEQTWWTFAYQPLRDETGAVVGMLCTTSDATAQVLGRRQAAQERERQQRPLPQMPGFAAVLSGPAHVFAYVNDAYRAIAGDRDFIGRAFRDVFAELAVQDFHELLDSVCASGRPYVARNRPLRLAGDPEDRFIDLLYQPIRKASGAASGIFVGGYDATEGVTASMQLRRLNETLEQRVQERTGELLRPQDALRQSQKLEAVGQLAGGIAHDFNNLLTVIGSSVELMRRHTVSEERRRKYLDAIGETVRRASKLTGQLLAFARRQPLHPEVFDVGRQVETVTELIRPLIGARVNIRLDFGRGACIAGRRRAGGERTRRGRGRGRIRRGRPVGAGGGGRRRRAPFLHRGAARPGLPHHLGTDAALALALLEEDNLRFDLVFSDVIMPGMNGLELARLTRSRYPGLPVVLTSGYSTALVEEGADGFQLVQKPYSLEALSRVIRQEMAKRASAA